MSELNKKIANLSSSKRAVLTQRLYEKRSRLRDKATIVRRNKQGPAPLSFAQERLWFLDQFERNNVVYNIPLGLRLKGALNVAVLQRCLDEIVRRHEALRTRFETVEAQPVQVVESSASLEMPLTDLSSLPQQQREAEAMRLCKEDAHHPFNLKCDLMLRVRLFRFGPTDHILLLNMHHIATDGWSIGVLFTELKTLYAAFVEGKVSPLPELPIQYADYAIWQRQWLQGEALENQLSYWRKQLEAVPERLELPTDRSRPAIQSYRGAMMGGELPNSLATALKELSRAEGATLFMTLLAAFQTLLHRYTGLEDIVVGSAIAGRNLVEVENLIGVFLNTLVLRGDLSGNPSFQTLLHRTREVALAAYAHQDLPFEKLVEALRPQRDTSHSPLFQVMFVLQNTPAETAQLANLEVTSFLTHTDTSKFDLTLSVREVGGSLTANVVHNTDLFDAATISRMLGHYQTLLEGIVAGPEQRILDLPLLNEAEKGKILVEWNNTRRLYPTNVCLHELVEARVDRTPDAIAVVCEDVSLTYREVNRRANQLAYRLRKLGVGPEVIVGVFAERSVEMVVGLLATLKAGGAYLPLDPDYPGDRLNFMLDDARPALVLVQRNLAAKLPQYAGEIVFLEDDFAAESDANPTNRTQPENLAYVIYTSGSTGRPKGVMNTHRGICNWLLWLQENYRLTADDRIMLKTPFTFDVSLGEFFWSLIAGSQLVVARPRLHGESHYLIKTISENSVTAIHFVPSMLSAFLEDKDAARCSSLRTVICIGEALSVELQERFFAVLPNAELHNLYGPTEAAVVVTYWKCQRGSGESIVPIGRPIANTQTYILDRAMQPVPPGVTGELHIGGVQLARGYLARPELTAEKFVQNPFGEGRLYKTGDLARYRSDGAIEFLGRIDSQVKIRGFRIELGEIETVLRQHPGVQESIVIAREDIPGDKRLVAYVVAREDTSGDERLTAHVVSRNGTASPSELRECLRVKLPDYMLPAAFVALDALPLTSSGKVDRRALPAPERSDGGATGENIQPINLLELELTRIWQRLFHRDDIGRQDNFFALGGHSLLATRLTAEIDKLLSCNLPIAALFQSPTIESLARRLNDGDWVPPWSSLVPLQPNGSKPPLFFVHGSGGDVYGFLDLAAQLGPDQPSFGIQAVGLDGKSARHITVEDMAAHYVREIVSFQKDGPLYLAGYSLGGVIAFEIAQQLQRLGRRVALVALLDSWPIGRIPWLFYGLAMATYIPGRCLLHFRRLWKLPLRERLTYVRGRWQAIRFWMVERNRSKPTLVTAPLPLGSEPPLYPGSTDYYLAVALPYHLRSYPGSVDLFVSDVAILGRRWYWRYLARGGATFHRVPGGHLEILSGENLPVLAKSLTAVLQRKQANERAASPPAGRPKQISFRERKLPPPMPKPGLA